MTTFSVNCLEIVQKMWEVQGSNAFNILMKALEDHLWSHGSPSQGRVILLKGLFSTDHSNLFHLSVLSHEESPVELV